MVFRESDVMLTILLEGSLHLTIWIPPRFSLTSFLLLDYEQTHTYITAVTGGVEHVF